MQIEKITDIKQVEAMICASEKHLNRIKAGLELNTKQEIEDMEMDLWKLQLRLEQLHNGR